MEEQNEETMGRLTILYSKATDIYKSRLTPMGKIVSTLFVLSALFLVSATSSAKSSELLGWHDSTKIQNVNYRYFIGRSGLQWSEELARDVATRSAILSANRQVFQSGGGTLFKGFEPELHGFECIDSQLLPSSNGEDGPLQVDLLFRYSIKQIELEKRRLALLAESEDLEQLNEATLPNSNPTQGANQKFGAALLFTEPSGASIILEGKLLGLSPLKVHGLNPSADIKLALRAPKPSKASKPLKKPTYLEKTIWIKHPVPGEPLHFHEKLAAGLDTIRIHSHPDGAIAFINGHFAGVTPMDSVEVPIQEPLLVELSHPNAVPIVKTVYATPNGKKDAGDFKMTLKPASLSVTTKPDEASIIVDGESFGSSGLTPTGMIQLEPRIHRIRILKKGFEPQDFQLEIRGGEKKELGPIVLVSEKEKLNRLLDVKRVVNISLLGGRRVNIGDSSIGTVTVGGGFEYRMARILGVRLETFFGYGSGEAAGKLLKSDILTQYDVNSEYVHLGFPIYPFDLHFKLLEKFYIEPEILGVWNQFLNQTTQTVLYSSQMGLAAHIGYRVFVKPSRETSAIWGIGIKLGWHDYFLSSGVSPAGSTFAFTLLEFLLSF